VIREFAIVLENLDRLLIGLMNTVLLSVTGLLLSLLLGIQLAAALMSSNRSLAWSIRALVDTMRCIPFLLLAYLVYYALPSLGLNFNNWTSGLVAIVVYNAGYMAEILRSIWVQLPRESIDAGTAFGFHGWNLYLRIILPQVVLAAIPMIGNQSIQVIKDTAFLMIIAVPELTHAASSIQSKYYVPFAAFISAVALYWAMCSIIEAGVRRVERVAEVRR
jgi:polar amino acid transport system permease protein